MDSRTAFCRICGQRLPDELSSSVCLTCQAQQQSQKQKVWLATGLIVLFLLMLTAFLSLELMKVSTKKSWKQAYVESILEKRAHEQAEYRKAQELTDKLNAELEKLNRVGARSVKPAKPDFGPYIAELQRRIRRNWNPPASKQNKHISVIFRIQRDGSLSDLHIHESSGVPAADQAALSAVRATAPFRQLPVNYRGKDIPVQFTFDYEISGHGASRKH